MEDLPVRPGADAVVPQVGDDGRPGWLFSDGMWLPLIRGGDGTGDGNGDGNGSGDGGGDGSGNGNGDPGTQPQGGDGTDPGGQDPDGSGDGDPSADAKKLIQEVRQEAAKYRTKAKELEAELKKHQDAQKSETERLRDQATEAQKKADEAETRLKDVRTTATIERLASKKGFRDPADAVFLVKQDGLETDADGAVLEASVNNALAEIAKTKPYLLGGTGGSPSNPNQDKGSLSWDEVQNMTPDQINENWDEVQKVLAARK